jgi:hypothetical protein
LEEFMGLEMMRTWYDRLSFQEKSDLDDLRKKVGDPVQMLPASHGETLEERLRSAEKKFFSQPEPFYFIRIGDCDIGLLNGGYPIFPKTDSLDWKLPMCGLDRRAFHLHKEYISAVKDAPLLGVHQSMSGAGQETSVTLSMLGILLPYDRAVDAFLPYHLLVKGGLFAFLQFRRVIFIGHLAKRLAHAFSDLNFINAFKGFGPIERVIVEGAIETSPREQFKWEEIGLVTELVQSMDFDVALLSCGAISRILAHRIWKMGKTAIDVGFVADALLGTDPYLRSQRAVLQNAQWPSFTLNGEH